MKQVKKAIIPAAGLGTRMLPISHAVPKEMLPIVDLPAVYYLVREAVDSGITDILIITKEICLGESQMIISPKQYIISPDRTNKSNQIPFGLLLLYFTI